MISFQVPYRPEAPPIYKRNEETRKSAWQWEYAQSAGDSWKVKYFSLFSRDQAKDKTWRRRKECQREEGITREHRPRSFSQNTGFLLLAEVNAEGSALGSTQLPTRSGGGAWNTEAETLDFSRKERCWRATGEHLKTSNRSTKVWVVS